jgi:hypothetical protein
MVASLWALNRCALRSLAEYCLQIRRRVVLATMGYLASVDIPNY